jgi:hypothetical protein
MENAYLPEYWRDLYVMLGTSSAALIGLLFIVTSLHLEKIMRHPGYRTRARNFLLHLIAILIQAAAILTPQSTVVLGAELLAINLCAMWLPISFTYKAFYSEKSARKQGGFSIFLGIFYPASYLLGIIGGASIINLMNWGMYLVTVACVILLVISIVNAWLMMVGVGLLEKTTKAN